MSIERLAEWFYDELPSCMVTASSRSLNDIDSTENENQQGCSTCSLRRRLIQAIPTVNEIYKRDGCGVIDMPPSNGHLPLLWQIGFAKWGPTSPTSPQEASAFMNDVCTEMTRAFVGQRDGTTDVAKWWTFLMDTVDVVGLEVAFGYHESEDLKEAPLAATLLFGSKPNPPDIETALDEKGLFQLSRWAVAVQCCSAGHLPSCESRRSLESGGTDSAFQVLLGLVNILGAILLHVPELRIDTLAPSWRPDAGETSKRSKEIHDAVVVGHAVRGFLTAASRIRLQTIAEDRNNHVSNETMTIRGAVSSMIQEWSSVEGALHAAVTLIEATLEVAWESPSQSNFSADMCDSMLRAVTDEWMLLLPRERSALDWLTSLFCFTAHRLQARWPHTSPLERPLALCFLHTGAGLLPSSHSGGSYRKSVAVVCSALLDGAIRRGNAAEGDEALLRAALRGHEAMMDEATFFSESTERCAARRGEAKVWDETRYFVVVLDAVKGWKAQVDEFMCAEEENEEEKENVEMRRYTFFEGWLNAMSERQKE